jgi:VanZ family protein
MSPTQDPGTQDPPSQQSQQTPPASHPERVPHGFGRAGRGALLVYTLAIVYASLNPFFGWRQPEAFTLFTWPRYLTTFDVLLNFLAYVPFGGILAALQLRDFRRRERHEDSWRVWWMSVGVGALLSLAMETLQAFLPVRVSSPVDFIANVAGVAIGAGLLVSTWGRAQMAGILAWRNRLFASRRETGWGLVLLAAWFIAQLNPVIPFFEAGHIANPFDTAAAHNPYEPLILLPQAVGITLNVCGFALLVSLLLHPAKRVVLNVLLIMGLGFLAKISMASLMLKAPQLVAWLAPATVIGLTAGLVLFAWFARIGYRWRAFCATLFIFAGGLMAKLASVYGAFDETLRLLNWPQGHIATFAGLTRWLHEVWPLLACLLAAWMFVRHRSPHSLE